MPKNNSRAQREKRKREAEARQEVRAKRAIEEQLQLLDTRPGNATRERIYLELTNDE